MNGSVSERKKFHQGLVRKGEKVKLIKPKFQFGKYKGKTVDWVLKNDPDYIVWCWRTVAKTYLPVGLNQELYDRCLGITSQKNRQIGRGRNFHPGDYDEEFIEDFMWAHDH